MALTSIRIAVPDLVTNTLFPLLAARELGLFSREGLDVEIELIHELAAQEALRAGKVAFSAGPAHAPLAAFPEWKGVRLVAAVAQGTPWLLVAASNLNAERGDLQAVKGRRIGAARGPDMALRHLLKEAGIDSDEDLAIGPIPGTKGPGVSFGVAAGRALAEGKVDAIWANALGGAVAIHLGGGSLLADLRRGDGPPGAGNYSFAALATTESRLESDAGMVAGVIRAIVRAQKALRQDPVVASRVAKNLFPPLERELVGEVVQRDAQFYDATISEEVAVSLDRFTRAIALTSAPAPYDQIVATDFQELWSYQP